MLKYELSSRTILLTLAAAVGWGSYQALDFVRSDEQAARDRQGSALARQVALNLPLPEGRPSITVAPFVGDDSRLLERKCREWLARRNVRVESPTTWQLLSEAVVTPSPPLDAATAVEQFGSPDLDGYVVIGEVLEWITYPDRDALLTVRIQLVDLDDGSTLHNAVFSVPEQETPSIGNVLVSRLTSDNETWDWQSLFWGLTAWLVLVFLAPWLLTGVIGPLLARDSNLANAALLSVLVILATASAWACWGRGCSEDIRLMATVLAGGLSIPYLGYACGQLNSLRS